MSEIKVSSSTGYQIIDVVREKIPRIALAAGLVLMAAACGEESDNASSSASATSASETAPTTRTGSSSDSPEDATLSEEEMARTLQGDGETEELVFDYLEVGSDDIFVYANPFESGKGPALFTYNDGEKFYGDCTLSGRLIESPNPQLQGDSDLWVLGDTQGGDRAFAPAVFLEGGPEYAEQLLEDCE